MTTAISQVFDKKEHQDSINHALVKAIGLEDSSETKRLLSIGADSNAICSETSQPVLTLAVLSKNSANFDFVNLLMVHGADPNLVGPDDAKQMSPFMCACTSNKKEAILSMLNSEGSIKVDLLATGDHDRLLSATVSKMDDSTHLMSVMQKHFEDNVLAAGSSKSPPDRGHLWLSTDKNGMNAFMLSSVIQNKRWILDQNFMEPQQIVELSDHQGETALWRSVHRGEKNCVEFLLGCGARIDVVDSSGQTLLNMAKENADDPDNQQSGEILGQLRAVNAARKAMAAVNKVINCRQLVSP